jgi:hypothetical protein
MVETFQAIYFLFSLHSVSFFFSCFNPPVAAIYEWTSNSKEDVKKLKARSLKTDVG